MIGEVLPQVARRPEERRLKEQEKRNPLVVGELSLWSVAFLLLQKRNVLCWLDEVGVLRPAVVLRVLQKLGFTRGFAFLFLKKRQIVSVFFELVYLLPTAREFIGEHALNGSSAELFERDEDREG